MNSLRGRRSSSAEAVQTPLAQEWPTMLVSTQSPVANSTQGRTVLVVEDNDALNDTMREALQSHGFAAQSARNSIEALQLLNQNPPDLVVSDLTIPEMDGHALLNRIRGNPKTRNIPVIFIMGHDSREQRRRIRETGVVDYLTKPIDEGDFIDTVQAVLRRHADQEADFNRRVEEVRNQILGLVQHEFRTPLTFVMGYAEYLQDAVRQDLPQEEIQHSVDAILEGSRRLHHLVESFLLLANLSRESLPPDEVYPLDPTALWRECIAEVRTTLEDAEITVRLTEPPDPVIVFGVMDLLREALSRMLDNAIRYRRPGARTIWLSTLAKPGYVGWMVRDEGVGIAPALLAQLSAPFVRLHQRQADGHGIGLGLTLVRRVAELHGGHLEIESEEGVGSTFTLWVSDEERM
jgi:two-component system sensor histidine kinase/response regulator